MVVGTCKSAGLDLKMLERDAQEKRQQFAETMSSGRAKTGQEDHEQAIAADDDFGHAWELEDHMQNLDKPSAADIAMPCCLYSSVNHSRYHLLSVAIRRLCIKVSAPLMCRLCSTAHHLDPVSDWHTLCPASNVLNMSSSSRT